MDHKTLSRKLTIEQTTRISKTSEDKLKYRVNHDSERSCICVRVSICLFAGIIHFVFIITLFYSLYLFIVFFYFISHVGLFVLWCFNATFNQIFSFFVAVSFMVEETGGQGENQLNFLCTSFQSSKVFES